MTHILILGAGFGGLELSARLAEHLADDADVTLIDRNESFVFGFTKLDVMFGRRSLDEVRWDYRKVQKRNVRFRHETVRSIDPAQRRVVTDRATYEADFLVVALGADLDVAATPGLAEGGYEFYSANGAQRVRDILPSFTSGTAVVGVLGSVFKCPPAPNEAALLLHDYLTERGVRDAVAIYLVSPLGSPIPISHETSAAIQSMLAERGIQYWPSSLIERLDPVAKVAYLADARTLPYDLFLAVPVHRAPSVVLDCGLAEDGWVAVDPATFKTRFPGVYAIGDATNAPVPKAGTIAEGQAATLADSLIADVKGGAPAPPYRGVAVCYIETGGDVVAKVDVDFFGGPRPSARFSAPSPEIAAEKRRFGSARSQRWFGG